jgi:hypothetical protein
MGPTHDAFLIRDPVSVIRSVERHFSRFAPCQVTFAGAEVTRIRLGAAV